MATVFGKDNINHYIAQELRKGNIVRIKKRSPQASEWTTPIVADYGMDASSANRIADSSENVNTLNKNSKNFSSPDTDVILPGVDSPSVSEDISVLENAESERGGRLYNYKAMEADEKEYRRMLKTHGKLADNEIDELFDTVDAVVERIKETIESDAELARAIDYAWDKDIDDRAYNPIKQNSDKLYKISLDFSTMCRKRILQQITQSQISRHSKGLKNTKKREADVPAFLLIIWLTFWLTFCGNTFRIV